MKGIFGKETGLFDEWFSEEKREKKTLKNLFKVLVVLKNSLPLSPRNKGTSSGRFGEERS